MLSLFDTDLLLNSLLSGRDGVGGGGGLVGGLGSNFSE